jgi:hypothetical protein
MVGNYIITDIYKKNSLDASVSLANNYLSIDNKLVNMDKIITISVNEIDSDNYIVEGQTSVILAKYTVDMICGIEPSCVIVPDRVEIETFNNSEEAKSFVKILYKMITKINRSS